MTTYVVRRLLVSIPVLFGIILAVFAITRILPGDACQVLLGERANQAACNAFNQAHGLDKPILEQFGTYVTGLFQGDLGTSFRTSRPVSALLVERIPMTLELSIYALTIATIGGLLLGIVAASRRNSSVDVVVMAGANVGVSIPIFVLGLLLVFVFANLLKDTPFALPPSGRLTPGVSIVPLAERWGLEDQQGPAADLRGLRFEHVHAERAAVGPMGHLHGRLPPPHPAGDRAGHDPARDHRAHHALEPARRPRPRLRSNCPSQGRRGRARAAPARASGMRCCRS